MDSNLLSNQIDASVQIVKSPYGRFAIDPRRDAQIFKHMRPTEHHQMQAIRLLELLAGPSSTVIDVGAHIGTVSIPLSYKAKRVISFEPSQASFDLLRKNISLNGIQNIDARNKGLGSKPGHASLAPMPEGNAGGQTLDADESGAIEVSMLDTEAGSADLIKIDVEGMEMEVLKGGTNLIERSKPCIFMEIFPQALRANGVRPRDVQSFFSERGYSLFIPFESKHADVARIGRIPNLFLIVALISPGSFFRKNVALTFDILAVPKGKTVPSGIFVSSAMHTIVRLAIRNVHDKIRRILKMLR